MPDMNDKNDAFDKWIIWRFRPTINHGLLRFTIDSMRESWNAALESTKEKRFGCHLDADVIESLGCDLNPRICPVAKKLIMQGKSKTDCEFWGEIK